MKESVINVKGLTVAYDGDPVLWQANVEIPKGRMTAIVGPNGAGKSTFLNALLDFIQPLTGNVSYSNLGQGGSSFKDLKDKIAYVPQKASVDWDFPTTVFDVVLMGTYGRLRIGQRPGRKEKALARESLAKVGMADFSHRQISQLSGGQRQRVFLARALAEQADLYILDEPLAGVDIKTEKIIMDLLRNEVKEGKTVIAVHHDLQTVLEYFDWVIFLNKTVMDSGLVQEVFNEKNIEACYHRKPLLIDEKRGIYV